MATKNFRVRNGIEVGTTTGSTNNATIDGATGDATFQGALKGVGSVSNNFFTLPNATGTNGQVLTSNGATAPTWTTFSSVGDVVGPATATDNALARFDGTTGKLIQNSNATLDDTGNLTLTGDLRVNGNSINSSTGVIALQLSGANVDVANDLGVYSGNISASGTGFSNLPITITRNTIDNPADTINRALILRVDSVNTPAVGLGTSLWFETVTAPSTFTSGGYIANQTTDITTPGSENFKYGFYLKSAGSLIERMSLDHLGNLTLDGGITVSGSTSGTVALNAPAVAGTQSYTLPVAQPAVNGYVLSSTTAGVMSWVASGGGGSGDVVGPTSATDNAIARYDGTTGKLIQNSLTTIDDSGNLSTAGNLEFNSGLMTTTNSVVSMFGFGASTPLAVQLDAQQIINIGGILETPIVDIGGNDAKTSVVNIKNNLTLPRDGNAILGMMNYNSAANASTTKFDATRRFSSVFAPSITSASGTGTTATVFFTPVGALYNVTITSTSGDFSCTNIYGNNIFSLNQEIYVAGTLTGTGSITGYTNPTKYYIINHNNTNTFQLSATLGGSPITTTVGTTTGLTFSDPQYPAPFKVGAKVLVTGGTAGVYHGVQTVTASTPNSVSFLSSATGAIGANVVVILYESIAVKGISLSNANAMNQDTWLNFRTYGAESTNTPGGQSVIQYEAARGTLSQPLPNQNGDFLGAFYLQSNLGNATDARETGTRFITTAASGTGSVATLTYASIGAAPATQGAWVTISGVVPAAYNGTYQVLSANNTQITYYSTASGAMTQPGFINILGSSTGMSPGITPALNFTTDSYRFPPEQFAFNATENHRTINLGTFTASAATNGVLTVSAISTTATTAASGTGSVATLSFAANATNSPPFLVGGLINVEGVTPTGYNGTWQVLSCSSTSVTFANTTTGVQTVAGTIKNYIFNGFQITPTTATTPILRTSTPFIFNQISTTNANGLLGAEGTYDLSGVAVPIAWTDTCTYSTMSAGMGIAFDQAAKSRVYNPSNRIRTFSLTPEITEFSSGQFGFSPQIYSFCDRRRLLTAITGGNTLTIPYHNLKIGDTLSVLVTAGGLTTGTAYYVATIVDVNNITLASDSALTTPVTGLTNVTGVNRQVQPYTNPTGFNLNLRNFRGNFNSNNGQIITVPNVLNDQLGQITFAGSRSGSIASPITGMPTLASSSFANSQIQTQTASITAQAAGDWTATSSPSKLVFATTATSSVTPTASLTVASDVITATAPIAFPAYTIAGKPVSGAVGQQICISDSPINAGKMAYWDTTNSRWSYIDTNTAV